MFLGLAMFFSVGFVSAASITFMVWTMPISETTAVGLTSMDPLAILVASAIAFGGALASLAAYRAIRRPFGVDLGGLATEQTSLRETPSLAAAKMG